MFSGLLPLVFGTFSRLAPLDPFGTFWHLNQTIKQSWEDLSHKILSGRVCMIPSGRVRMIPQVFCFFFAGCL